MIYVGQKWKIVYKIDGLKKERKIRVNDVIVGQKYALKMPWIGNTLAVQQMASKTQLTQIISQQQKPQDVMIFARKKQDHSEWKVFVKVRKNLNLNEHLTASINPKKTTENRKKVCFCQNETIQFHKSMGKMC